MKLGSDQLVTLIELIDQGDEEDLKVLSNAVQDRLAAIKRQKANRVLAEVQTGDTVRLRNVKPKYLNGTRGQVTGRKGGKFTVELLDPVDPRALRRFGRIAVCPPSIIEKVS